jgi:glycerophosphoryl diester phosphodiesterase
MRGCERSRRMRTHRCEYAAHDSGESGRDAAAADGPCRARPCDGLLVHVWTLRNEPVFLSPTYREFSVEFWQFRGLGVDGLFTDFPDAGTRALRLTPFSR